MATTIEYLCPNCTRPLALNKSWCRCGHTVVNSPIGFASRLVTAKITGSEGPGGRYAAMGDGNDQAGEDTIADGGTIAHGLGVKPPSATATGSVSGEVVYITAMSTTLLTVAIKTKAGAGGTQQAITWTATNVLAD